MNQPSNPRHYSPKPKRPASIAELAERALDNLWDQNKDLKHYLRLAEKYRRDGKEFVRTGDLESGFVQFAKAATLMLEKLPLHCDYYTLLNPEQRQNLGLHGQDILDNLSDLTPTLVDRLDRWLQAHTDRIDNEPTPNANEHQPRPDDAQAQGTAPYQEDEKRREQGRLAAEEAARLKHQREGQEEITERNRKDVVGVVRLVAHVPQRSATLDDGYSRPQYGSTNTIVVSDVVRHQQQQEEMRKREDEITERHSEARWLQEQHDGIAQRQHEAESVARAARQGLPASSQPAFPQQTAAWSSLYQPAPPPPSHPYQQQQQQQQHASNAFTINYLQQPTPPSTVSFSHQQQRKHCPSNINYPQRQQGPPLSTNQPQQQAPPPSNYSQQQQQPKHSPSAITYSSSGPSTAHAQPQPVSWYDAPRIMPLENSTHEGNSMDSEPVHSLTQDFRRLGTQRQALTPERASMRSPSYPLITTTSPPSRGGRISYPQLMSQHQKCQGYYPSLGPMFEPLSHTEPRVHTLKLVSLPRECLLKFLDIATPNTMANRETCGLLLGKDKGHELTVTTLLIPKQHVTSDTCAMDEVGLVMQFKEERSLITLGWIHTHPSQSCFLSSVDLHTHFGFQRMLPESFAVVCAPNSNPNFGIFRLTDPGLTTVLECYEKEVFHSHPVIPIYTDADKGHVQLKNSSLEVVDLR